MSEHIEIAGTGLDPAVWTRERVGALARAYTSGKPLSAVGAAAGVSKVRALIVTRKLGLKRPERKGRSPISQAAIVLYEANYDVRDILEITGMRWAEKSARVMLSRWSAGRPRLGRPKLMSAQRKERLKSLFLRVDETLPERVRAEIEPPT